MSVGWTYWLMATERVMVTVIGEPFQDEVTKMARLPPCSVSLALCLSSESLLPPDVLSKPLQANCIAGCQLGAAPFLVEADLSQHHL